MAETQGDLFRPMCGRTTARQGDLFAPGYDEVSHLVCCVCGAYLVRTPSGYLCCPAGHGKLREAEPTEEPYGSWFEDEPGQE
jgi:hypothetical protein